MFIRQTRTNNKATGESYFTHRLVRSERIQGKVRQITVLNLGRHFPFEQDQWPLVCQRIEQILSGQAQLPGESWPENVERSAQRHAAAILAQTPNTLLSDVGDAPETPQFSAVDVDSLQLAQPRSVGVEHLGLHALSQLGFVEKLTALGINAPMRAAIIGNIIGRMAKPASELATWEWLQKQSALGELIDFDYTSMPHMRLYRASDTLIKHRAALENHLFSTVSSLFSLQETVTLYDLTNTYFEGSLEVNEQAKHGRSKEKRSDCPLVTLGLVLDGSGFVRRSQVFAGNVSEGGTLETMLSGLAAPTGALVIMDAGIATEANVEWLVARGYRYLVVKRGGTRQFDEQGEIASLETAGGERVRIQKQMSEDGKELRLYCHSEGREKKESAMTQRFMSAFEAALQKIADGLQTSRGEKNYDKLMVRLGRLKQKSRGASQHYRVELVPDVAHKKATAITWEKVVVGGTMASHPGVYCLRSNELTWDEEKLWRTYTMLTDLESVFRSLKTELGLRPVYHRAQERVDGHLFITVLAYQCVQVLRTQLKASGLNDRWSTLRETLCVQRRVTATFRQQDGSTLHVRKSTNAEPDLQKIYRAIGVNALPGGTKKMIV